MSRPSSAANLRQGLSRQPSAATLLAPLPPAAARMSGVTDVAGGEGASSDQMMPAQECGGAPVAREASSHVAGSAGLDLPSLGGSCISVAPLARAPADQTSSSPASAAAQPGRISLTDVGLQPPRSRAAKMASIHAKLASLQAIRERGAAANTATQPRPATASTPSLLPVISEPPASAVEPPPPPRHAFVEQAPSALQMGPQEPMTATSSSMPAPLTTASSAAARMAKIAALKSKVNKLQSLRAGQTPQPSLSSGRSLAALPPAPATVTDSMAALPAAGPPVAAATASSPSGAPSPRGTGLKHASSLGRIRALATLHSPRGSPRRSPRGSPRGPVADDSVDRANAQPPAEQEPLADAVKPAEKAKDASDVAVAQAVARADEAAEAKAQAEAKAVEDTAIARTKAAEAAAAKAS